MASKPAPIARMHTQHTLLHQQHAAQHASRVQARQTAHAAAVQRKADARAARLASRNGSAVVAPSAPDSLATPIYASGQSGGGAAGYGGGYQYAESQADTGANQSTGGDSDVQTEKKKGLSTKTKIWLGVGAGVVVVGFIAYRRITAPLRRYQRVKGLVQNIAAGFSNLKREVTA